MTLRFDSPGLWKVGFPRFGAPGIAALVSIAGTILIGVGLLGLPQDVRADETRVEAYESSPSHAVRRWQEATPAERRELREMGRRRWENASPRERRIFLRGMRALGRALPEFSSIERLVLLRKIFALSKGERKALRKRLRRIDDLEPRERDAFVGELRSMLNETPGETARIERNIARWRKMSEPEREKYREQMRRFRAMSTEERQGLLDEWADPKAD